MDIAGWMIESLTMACYSASIDSTPVQGMGPVRQDLEVLNRSETNLILVTVVASFCLGDCSTLDVSLNSFMCFIWLTRRQTKETFGLDESRPSREDSSKKGLNPGADLGSVSEDVHATTCDNFHRHEYMFIVYLLKASFGYGITVQVQHDFDHNPTSHKDKGYSCTIILCEKRAWQARISDKLKLLPETAC